MAIKVIAVPLLYGAEQVEPQLMELSKEVTVPPVGATIETANVIGVKVAETEVLEVIERLQVIEILEEQAPPHEEKT